ncbi:MAG: PhzF family phenazine biosynthesis protein [Intrasporangium sp.]|uniref:PhzF family phenazine biosynthesis protein n=1 Tax=Intrasporangium sp. TaxID=1925024 RepID=UPI003F7F5075
MDLRYRLLNVFAIEGQPFSGNPLCVFEDAAGLGDDEMLAWARQFNLSETTFVTALDGDEAAGQVRIFTPGYEMPFAGHPTLGTAHVLADLLADGGARPDAVTLRLPAGDFPVARTPDGWRLQAQAPRVRDADASPAELAAALGLDPEKVCEGDAQWVTTGVEQLLVRVTDVNAVRAAVPDVPLLERYATSETGSPQVYVWAWTGDDSVEVRLFAVSGSWVDEDPATGSACANLGGWLVSRGRRDLAVTVIQGAAVGRPSRLHLTVDGAGTIFVAGRVEEVGGGTLRG